VQRSSRPDHIDAQTATFEDQRSRLLGVSYRILGSIVDAEDVVQDAWLRWSAPERAQVGNSEAFLTTIVTRLSIDRLRQLKSRREVYAGPWLPEPVSADVDPQAAAELADSLSVAVLVLLETLSPLERAAFVLHDVFGEPYPDVARILSRDEVAVRQLVHRARRHLDDGGARYRADRAAHTEVVQRFTDACRSADLEALLAVLAPDVVLVSDGGGVARAPVRPIHSADKVARFLLGATTGMILGTEVAQETFNGLVGLVVRLDGRAVTAVAFTVRDHSIQTLHLIANPAKLAALNHPNPSALQ
jgi:RNA polymerase sigma-70 factor, ECF subfamily